MAVINGTSGNDTLNGEPGNDVSDGEGGQDTLSGGCGRREYDLTKKGGL